jgi:ADP-ribosylarginine hydrolase
MNTQKNIKNMDTQKNIKKDKIFACLLISSYLDTLGFFNGDLEIKPGRPLSNFISVGNLMYELIFRFFILGGPNHISIKKLRASDDTILLLATTEAIINGGGELNYVDRYILWFPILNDDIRVPGITTIESLQIINNNKKKNLKTYQPLISYKSNMGGNGAAIRTALIGIKWFNDIDKIIEESLIASRITHNYSIGFLGGIVSAIFTSFAFNDIEPWLWIDKLLEIYESGKITNQINKTNLKNTINEEIKNYFIFFYKYKEERLQFLLTFRAYDGILQPIKQMEELLTYNYLLKRATDQNFNSIKILGSSGLDSIIISYEALILSIIPNPDYSVNLINPTYSWESLLFFSSLHIGDTDSTGAISGAWFGALNGFKNFDQNKLIDLEFYNQLIDVGDKLYNQMEK